MPESLFNLENLYQAYLQCRRHKRGTINALRFEAGLLDNICDLRDELVNRSYHPSTSICFVQRHPKMREIFAADFRDRVVHHLLVSHLEPIFEPRFIHDSYACRLGKGIHSAVARLRGFLNKVTANGTLPAWYLKEDISGFFMNIDKDLLYEVIRRHTSREEIRWLAKVIIFHDCTMDYHFKGDRSMLGHIPPHKTLFLVPRKKGLPIGNLTSQFFANVYLNELDQFIKRQLKCRFYLRYCDDFLLLSRNRDELLDWRDAIENFVMEKLFLQMNQSAHRLRSVANGIDFLGYIVRRRYVLVRRRVVNHFRERLTVFNRRLSVRKKGSVVGWCYPGAEMEALRSVTASYLGHMGWADSHRLVDSLFDRFPVLKAAFMLQNGGIIPRYLVRKPAHDKYSRYERAYASKSRLWRPGGSLRKTYRWWVPPARRPVDHSGKEVIRPLWVRDGEEPKVLVFFPAGRFYEFYDSQAEVAYSVLGLKLFQGLRGFRLGCGFHRRLLGRNIHKALAAGFHVALLAVSTRVDGSLECRLARLFRAL